MNLIEHIVEPERLILAWQQPGDKDRKRRAVADLIREDNLVRLSYQQNSLDFKEAVQKGFEGLPAFPLKFEDGQIQDYSDQVLDIFRRRLPPRTRSDFQKFLKNYRLPQKAVLSDFALLGYTEARLPGDGFSVVNDFSEAEPPVEFVTELAGYRFCEGKNLITESILDQKVRLVPEPTNEFDPNAVKVELVGRHIGYINRIQAKSVCDWLRLCCVDASIDRVNVMQDRLRVYLFIKVTAR